MKPSTFNSFVFFSFFESLQPVLVISSLFFLSLGFSTSDIFLLKAVFLFSVFIFDIPGGIALDHFGPKLTLSIAKTFEIFGLFILLFSKNIVFISAAMILMGISLAFVSGSRAAISKILESNSGVDHKKSLAYANFAMLASYSLTLFITGFGKFESGKMILLLIQILSSLFTIYFIFQVPNNYSVSKSVDPSRISLKTLFTKDNINSSVFIFAFYIAIIRILVELLPISLTVFSNDPIALGFILAGFALLMALSSWAFAAEKVQFFKDKSVTQIFKMALASSFLLAPTNSITVIIGLLLFIFVRTLGDVLIPSAVLSTVSNNNSNGTRLSVANSIGAGLASIISYVISIFQITNHMFYFISILTGIVCLLMILKKRIFCD